MSNPPGTLDRPAGAEFERDPIAAFYRRADALYRFAVECCRQHERFAELVERDTLQAEQRAAQTVVSACDDALAELVSCYERAAARARPAKEDAAGRAANGLWLAAREYGLRHRASAQADREIGDTGEHATRFAELAVGYDLEASALLQLKQATEAYRKARPQAAA